MDTSLSELIAEVSLVEETVEPADFGEDDGSLLDDGSFIDDGTIADEAVFIADDYAGEEDTGDPGAADGGTTFDQQWVTRDIFVDWESGGVVFDKIEGGESTVDPVGDGEIAYCDDDFIIVDDFTFEDCWLNEDEGGIVDEPLPDETDVSEGEVIDYPADMEDFPVICVLYPCEMMV